MGLLRDDRRRPRSPARSQWPVGDPYRHDEYERHAGGSVRARLSDEGAAVPVAAWGWGGGPVRGGRGDREGDPDPGAGHALAGDGAAGVAALGIGWWRAGRGRRELAVAPRR